MNLIRKRLLAILVLLVIAAQPAIAQFEKPDIQKVTHDQRQEFMQRFSNIKWTGQGLYGDTGIDDIQTDTLRAWLQAVYGNPTQTLEDNIKKSNFRPAEAIQFEYWFTVDDSIPLMVLDIDGPFGEGLVYGGASRYIDLMPQIKRTLTRELLAVKQPVKYQDYFYSPERQQWFNVQFTGSEFVTEKIDAPEGMTINFSYPKQRRKD